MRMNDRTRKRSVYVTPRQKKKLVELITRHPELIACKVTSDFSYQDSHRLWQNIANECNSIPGARKTWKQWRKTWHDLRSNAKKRQVDHNGDIPSSLEMLTSSEQEVLGLKSVTSDTFQDLTEFIPMEQENTEQNYNNEMESIGSLSEPESPPEVKVFTHSKEKLKRKSGKGTSKSKHSDECFYNCDVMAAQEQRKIQIKSDYLNFKKDYLKQKLKLLREQTEALKTIAREISK